VLKRLKLPRPELIFRTPLNWTPLLYKLTKPDESGSVEEIKETITATNPIVGYRAGRVHLNLGPELTPQAPEVAMESQVVEARLRALVHGISIACKESTAFIIPAEARLHDVTALLVGESATPGTIVLGLSCTRDLLGSVQDQIEGSLSEHVRIDYKAEAKAYGQACLLKRNSERQGINYHYIMKKTPCPGITHHIFFETENERKTFEGMLQRCAPTGMICMNGGNQAWASAVSCLENAKPLFVFDHLGDASSIVVEMLRWRMMSQQRDLPQTSSGSKAQRL
jgi:hypothetical protein